MDRLAVAREAREDAQLQRARIGLETQSENAVRKDRRNEKDTCNDVEYRHDDFAVGHAGRCAVAGHPVPARPGRAVPPRPGRLVPALGRLQKGVDARERGRGCVQGRQVVRGGRQGQGGDGAAEEVADADEVSTGPGRPPGPVLLVWSHRMQPGDPGAPQPPGDSLSPRPLQTPTARDGQGSAQ